MWYLGEGFAGAGPTAAHINAYLGPRQGPVGQAFAAAAAAPSMGYIPFQVCMAPNVAVKPVTLFVAKADLRGDTHSTMTWGPAQAGVARAVAAALLDGTLPPEAETEWCIIAAAWVPWSAEDADQIYANNRDAMRDALTRALTQKPDRAEIAQVFDHITNPFYTPRTL